MEEPLTAEQIKAHKDQQIVISSFFSLANDNKDIAKPMMEQLSDSQVTIAITDPTSESNTASEVVIIQSDGQRMSTENQILTLSEELSDVAETVIIQGVSRSFKTSEQYNRYMCGFKNT
ncbi:hypothetical protein KUTeg_020019 [Tegillarca granosa]|uniref:Uncharacterized protein n=1 Tax=Tegillarca granosa TaxID=220873 RepID=A0ABQ9EE91_TEGGR|nr:hypothetical protein KUTeg_020019 [Tegillarca granosa]